MTEISLVSVDCLDNYYKTDNKDIKESITVKIKEIQHKKNQIPILNVEELLTLNKDIENLDKSNPDLLSKYSNNSLKKKTALEQFLQLKNTISERLHTQTETLHLIKKIKTIDPKTNSFQEIQDLISQVKNNNVLSTDKKLIKYLNILSIQISNALKIKEEKQQQEEIEPEDNPKIVLLRNLIKLSFEETALPNIIKLSPYELLRELNLVIALETPNIKANELKNKYIISHSFKIFVIELSKESHVSQLKKIIAILYSLYAFYFKQIEFSLTDFSRIIQMHNNIEMLLIVISYHILLSTLDEETLTFYRNTFIMLKNLSAEMFYQIISNFISQLTIEMSKIETFESVSLEVNYSNCEKTLKKTQLLTFQFFNSLKEFAIEREFVYNLNYILSLLFDVLNRKILLVKDFTINDIKSILSICKTVAPELKKNLSKIAGDDRELSITLIEVFEQNGKYKKFEEILFVLNANLKEIKNYIIEANLKIHIDANELIELVKSIFESNENSNQLIDFIKGNLLDNNIES